MTVVNAIQDSGSDTTLITSDLAKALKLKGKQRTLNTANAISLSVSNMSKLVEFTVSSNHHPEQIKVKNAWVGPLHFESTITKCVKGRDTAKLVKP